MEKYNYLEELIDDILIWLDSEPYEFADFESKEELREHLFDELWPEDTITGNGQCYYASEKECEEFLCHNIDLLHETIEAFDITAEDFYEHFKDHNLCRYLDCSIRCYLFSEALERVMDTLEKRGVIKYMNKEGSEVE